MHCSHQKVKEEEVKEEEKEKIKKNNKKTCCAQKVCTHLTTIHASLGNLWACAQPGKSLGDIHHVALNTTALSKILHLSVSVSKPGSWICTHLPPWWEVVQDKQLPASGLTLWKSAAPQAVIQKNITFPGLGHSQILAAWSIFPRELTLFSYKTTWRVVVHSSSGQSGSSAGRELVCMQPIRIYSPEFTPKYC